MSPRKPLVGIFHEQQIPRQSPMNNPQPYYTLKQDEVVDNWQLTHYNKVTGIVNNNKGLLDHGFRET